jgi:hypothetical protein
VSPGSLAESQAFAILLHGSRAEGRHRILTWFESAALVLRASPSHSFTSSR